MFDHSSKSITHHLLVGQAALYKIACQSISNDVLLLQCLCCCCALKQSYHEACLQAVCCELPRQAVVTLPAPAQHWSFLRYTVLLMLCIWLAFACCAMCRRMPSRHDSMIEGPVRPMQRNSSQEFTSFRPGGGAQGAPSLSLRPGGAATGAMLPRSSAAQQPRWAFACPCNPQLSVLHFGTLISPLSLRLLLACMF